jgi:hypothetical protein
MAVVTEPPWIHKSQGVAPRNGTNSHTITFTTDGDAPFTPATGSLLLVYIGGGVTNAASGWTEVEQPVSSGELSAFTIVSASTTSITVTHNASNYPCPWVVKEYPAGSVVTSSTSSNTTNDTFPTLSGLTGGAGNERVIDAAFLRVADGGESGFSAVWGSSFIEDADQYIAQSPTDGAGFTSGHLINVTATSSMPTITPTYGGTWTINDREKIVMAINAVAVTGTDRNDDADPLASQVVPGRGALAVSHAADADPLPSAVVAGRGVLAVSHAADADSVPSSVVAGRGSLAVSFASDADPLPSMVVNGNGLLVMPSSTAVSSISPMVVGGRASLAMDSATAVKPLPVMVQSSDGLLAISSDTKVKPAPVLMGNGAGLLTMDLVTIAEGMPVFVLTGSGDLILGTPDPVDLALDGRAMSAQVCAGRATLAIDHATVAQAMPIQVLGGLGAFAAGHATTANSLPMMVAFGSGNLTLAAATGIVASLWDGTQEVPLTLAGVWNGSQLVPATFEDVT